MIFADCLPVMTDLAIKFMREKKNDFLRGFEKATFDNVKASEI